jgi:prophage antirepressor-like protein
LFEAASHRVAGVEGEGRHEWYGFRGTRLRIFLDANGAPWLAVKELAHVLDIRDTKEAFSLYGPTEYASPSFADGEPCVSDRGLRRFIKYSKHPDAHAIKLWWEREVLLPLNRRRELFTRNSADRDGSAGCRD